MEDGAKNPLKGTSMKLLVFAADAQLGVRAESQEIGGDPQWHVGDDPRFVETYEVKTHENTPAFGKLSACSVACLE